MDHPQIFTEDLLAWFHKNRRSLPWRENRTAYRTWISEIMLQQTRVSVVIPFYTRFLRQFPSIFHLAQASLDEVYKSWEGLGYYSRARNLQKGAQYCVEHFAGDLPQSVDELLRIPGVGPYTAGAIASQVYNLPVPAIDGNAIRVFSRLLGLFISPQDSAGKKEIYRRVLDIIPKDSAGDFNEAIMELGAIICTPGHPKCGQCPITCHCEALSLNVVSAIPLKNKKQVVPVKDYTIFILQKGEEIYLQKRPDTGLLAGLYEFFTYPEKIPLREVKSRLQSNLGVQKDAFLSVTKLGDSHHIFSHLKWEMTGYLIRLSDAVILTAPSFCENSAGSFIPLTEAQKKPFPSALKAYTNSLFQR